MIDQVFLGGYFLVQSIKKSKWMTNELLPEKIITVSNCICDIIPSTTWTWPLSMKKNKKKYIKSIQTQLRLSDEQFQELIRYSNDLFNQKKLDWPSGFEDKSTAINLYEKFLSHLEDVFLLGIGLTEEQTNVFLEEEKPTKKLEGSFIYNMLNKKEALDLTNFIGFDVLGYEMGGFHSYLCNGLEKLFFDKFSLKPNAIGLFDSYEKSKAASCYVNSGKVAAEPALWQAWAVCNFKLADN